ncbi:MAG: hypothetical protein ACO1NZ_04560 [Adhaeribacter sp.]
MVNPQGDTLRGFINYQEWNFNPEKFTFKLQPGESQSQVFGPETARAIAIEGYEVFEAHLVSISQDEVAGSRLKEGPDTTTIRRTVFLKLLQKGGKVNLYSWKDILKERFYILEKGTASPVELGYKVYLENSNIATSALYKQQLAALAVRQQVFSLTEQIKAAAYHRGHLVKIISKINGNTNSSISKTLEQAPGLRWFGSVGLNYTTFNYKGENELMIDGFTSSGLYTFKDKIITHSLLPMVSAGADIYLNPALQRFVFRGELNLAPVRSEVKTQYQHPNYSSTSPLHDQSNVYNLSFLNISASPQILMNAWNTERIKWYLGAGGTLSYRLVQEDKLHLKITQQETVMWENEKDNFYDVQKIAPGMLLRTGMVLHNKTEWSLVYALSARHNLKSTDRHATSTLRSSSIQLSGYYFFNR